jgi:hypothetical protein
MSLVQRDGNITSILRPRKVIDIFCAGLCAEGIGPMENIAAVYKNRSMRLLSYVISVPVVIALVAVARGYDPYLVQTLASLLQICCVTAILVKLAVCKPHKES